MFCDFHSHFINKIDPNQKINISFYDKKSVENFLNGDFLSSGLSGDVLNHIKISLGVHPWYIHEDFYCYIEKKIDERSLNISLEKSFCAIGEIGFDFQKNPDINLQQEIFEKQVNLAILNNFPIIIHNVKGFHQFVKNVNLLKKVKACVFHGFSGTYEEANYFLRNDVNAFFSFGGNILKNHKKSIETLEKLPIHRIGLETDNENFEKVKIQEVYKKAFEVKNLENQEKINLFVSQIQHNFDSIFT